MFRLETDRLIIRPWMPDDRAAFTALTHDPAVMQYVHGGLPYTEDEVDEWFSRQARLGMQYEARYTGAQLGHRKPEIVVDLFFRGRGPQGA